MYVLHIPPYCNMSSIKSQQVLLSQKKGLNMIVLSLTEVPTVQYLQSCSTVPARVITYWNGIASKPAKNFPNYSNIL
jgi:hypothetical protein